VDHPNFEKHRDVNKFTLFMKILVLGSDSDVVQEFLKGFDLFSMREMPAYGMEILILDLTIDGLDVKFQIWKANIAASFTMGKEFLLPADGAILIFNKDTFEHANGWIEEIWKNESEGNIPLALYGHNSLNKDNNNNNLKEKIEKITFELSKETSSDGYYLRYFEFKEQSLENRKSVMNFLGQQMIQSSPRAISHYKNEANTAETEREKLLTASKRVTDKLKETKEGLTVALKSMKKLDLHDTSDEDREKLEELDEWKEEVNQLEKEISELNTKAKEKDKESTILKEISKELKKKHKKAIIETKAILKKH